MATCRSVRFVIISNARWTSLSSRAYSDDKQNFTERKTRKGFNQRERHFIPLARYPRMKPHEFNENIEWSSVYQTARPFDPYIIPLSIRMGRPGPGEVPPVAQGNIELLKIPNFFHLTPPAIERHCKALKNLCTPWPSELPSLPLKISTINSLSPSSDISDEKSRIVTLQFCVSDLPLPSRSKDKMIALSDHRYNSKTDIVTLVGERCPTRKQNEEYVLYLMKVLYLESQKHEQWEDNNDLDKEKDSLEH